MKALAPQEFQDILRPAFREEEIRLMLVGGAFGLMAGAVQFLVISGLPG
jgi:hypothetical protein